MSTRHGAISLADDGDRRWTLTRMRLPESLMITGAREAALRRAKRVAGRWFRADAVGLAEQRYVRLAASYWVRVGARLAAQARDARDANLALPRPPKAKRARTSRGAGGR